MNVALSIAGFDPSGGAGITADMKVFHQFEIQGYGVITALTYQNHDCFYGLKWMNINQVESQLKPVMGKVNACKIGIVPNLYFLKDLTNLITKYNGKTPIIWDPVIKSSTGFQFLKDYESSLLEEVLQEVFVITPNSDELVELENMLPTLFDHVNVVVKGGHKKGSVVTDTLFMPGQEPIQISTSRLEGVSKHGTGCAFSSALTASIVKGETCPKAFHNANNYVFKLLQTGMGNESMHHEIVWGND